MNARATRRPGSRGRRSSGRGLRGGGGRSTDSQTPGCALFLITFVGLVFMAAGTTVYLAVT
jgi:hypothetical protein